MLHINNVNKYFNKGHKNQIHVINNTTLEFENIGLVALLGPSGCGKTTLLNTIGGLDKIKSGSIYVDGKKISSKSMYKVDRIRNLDIGYIFQDYKLIENLSVFDNVAIVLKMLGLKDKEEIKKRVEYVLDKVGMLRYKKRPASMLSGGERQRVGIARAIVKTPNIILADEPTGNLDSKNTIEIMNIIKAISKECLVILVTHEADLAKFYATRIIEVEDGSIKNDYVNDKVDELDYRHDFTFYLKDFNNKTTFNDKLDNSIDIDIYGDKKLKLKLDIVLKNGNIYIKSNSNEKIEIVDENSSIEFINGKYKAIKKDEENYNFDFNSLKIDNDKKRYKSIFNIISLLGNGFKRVFGFPLLKKFLLAGFFLAAMFIMYSVSGMGATLRVDETDFITKHKSYIEIEQSNISLEDYAKYEGMENINYVMPGSSRVIFTMPLDDYYQTRGNMSGIVGSLTSIDLLGKDDLISGRMPDADYEIVVDKVILDGLLEKSETLKNVGITECEQFLERVVNVDYMDNFKIVGISNTTNPSIYINNGMIINVLANSKNEDSNTRYGYTSDDIDTDTIKYLDYGLYQNKVTLTKGRWPSNDYEVIVNKDMEEVMPLNKEIKNTINGKKLVVVGYYDSVDNYNYYLVSANTVKINLITSSKGIIMSVNNTYKNSTLQLLRYDGKNAKDCYTESKKSYNNDRKNAVRSALIVSGIILGISLVEIYLMIRSSFLSRVKEIGILRAIGVKRRDIYKMFSGEIIAITTIASIPGLLFMAYILNIMSGVKYIEDVIMINPVVVGIAVIFVYLFNLIVGLIPVFNVIRKRPAEILARYDLD